MQHSSNRLKPALFVHIQKTAGTSIILEAHKHYGQSIVSHGDCWGKNYQDLKGIAFISGHVGYDFARPLFRDRFSFTFLRNPIDRVISMYYFCKSQKSSGFKIYEKANNLSFIEFLKAGFHDPLIKKNIWNNQVWQLAHGYAHLDGRTIDDFTESELLYLAKANLKSFSYIGLTETFDEDAKKIFAKLNIDVDKFPVVNMTNAKPSVCNIPKEALDMLNHLTKLDSILYAHVLEMRNDFLSHGMLESAVSS